MSEKTEQPTDKKRRDARQEGQVAYSQDLTQLFTFLGALICLMVAGQRSFEMLMTIVVAPAWGDLQLEFARRLSLLGARLLEIALHALLPILLASTVAGLAGDLSQNGFLFTPKKIVPSFAKLNVVSNIKNRFSYIALVDLLKTLAKTGLLLLAASIAGVYFSRDIMKLGVGMPSDALAVVSAVLKMLSIIALIVLVPVAILDVFWQRAQLTKKLKMAKHEVKREFKETEGAPEIKGERRRRHQELSTEEIRRRVQRSSVVIVNPVHFAVGLFYEFGKVTIPVVTLRDYGRTVPRIKHVATQENVPIVCHPALARALFATARVGEPMPIALLEAVTPIILSLVQVAAEERAAAGPGPDPT